MFGVTGNQMSDSDKREAIIQATLDLIAENGLQNTPMSLISKRSKASAGIIYHYFENKDDLIQTIYRRVKSEMFGPLIRADDPQQPLARRFQSLLLAAYHYCFTHPREIAFMEQCESLPQHEDETTEEAVKGLYNLLQDLRSQDLIKNLPDEVIGGFTLDVMCRLARQASAGVISIDEPTLNAIAGACWDAIAR
jgi:AcrR family transcriptional regulator